MVSWPSCVEAVVRMWCQHLLGKGEGLRRFTITVTAEDVRQFWRCGTGKGGEGISKAPREHLESAVGFWIGR